MRTKNSIINISAGIGNQLIITALSFISRTVFINSLGIEYLGVNALFINILGMLTLAEAGIGSSIVYSLYKPVADNDQAKINLLMRLYKRAYLVIALVVTLLGLSLLPFLDYVVKDSGVPNLPLIFFIFLLNTVIPYLFSYKNSFLNVSQKTYVVTLVFSVSAILSTSLKIGILYYTDDYILYLIVDCIITVLTAIVLVVIVNRMYPFLKDKVVGKLDIETRNGIVKNVKAIVIQNIGAYLVLGTENILISSFVSIVAVGLYSNYKMLIDIGRTFINQIFGNMYHSIGNLVSVESTEKIYSVYKVMLLLSFWLYSLFTIIIYVLIEPFIRLWIGTEFLMTGGVLIVLMLLFYERGMRNAISTIKTTSGIFHEDRYVPLGQAVVSLTISIVLVHQIGIIGIFLGSFISTLLLPFWVTPLLVYRKVFHKPLLDHYRKIAYYSIIGFITICLTDYISGFIHATSFMQLVVKAIVAFLTVNLVYLIVFHRTEEYTYLWGIAKSILRKLNRQKVTDEST